MLPILYHGHELTLYSYPLFMGLGWGIAYQIYFGLVPVTSSRLRAQTLFWGVFLCAWLGAKILFLLTYPGSTDFAGELSFWTGGGFVFYGGLLAGLLFLCLFRAFSSTLSKDELWPVLPALAIGHAIGRLGCFLAGCCFGKPTNFFWGVYMHQHYRHPTQLMEAAGLSILGIYLYRRRGSRLSLLTTYLCVYGLLRFGIETLRGDGVRGAWGPMSPAQWISLALVGVAILLYCYSKFNRLSVSQRK